MSIENVETIKKLKKQGYDKAEIADKLELSIKIVDEAFDIIGEEKVAPAKAGYFSSLVERKMEENSSLREIQDVLATQVSALWKVTHMLEQKKRYLEKTIIEMESYIKKGSLVADIFIKQGVEIDKN